MRNFAGVFAMACGLLLYSTAGHAQATRTWVSGVGDDVNPCSRTAPCKTFAGAISKTAAGGEISVLDPGGFGAVTITKSITLNGDGTLAGILAAGVNGIIVSSLAPATAKITLRNLSINGASTGTNGIRVLGGAQTIIDHCTIYGFTGQGVDIASGVQTEVYIKDSTISDVGNAVGMNTSGTNLIVTIDNTLIANPISSGLVATGGTVLATMTRSTIAGAPGSAVIITAGSAQVNVDSSTVMGNATAFNATAGTIRISNNNIYSNVTPYSGNVATAGNNRTGGNGAGSPGGGNIVQQ
jgi:hypothetical protein